ncbi:MAG: hypothetical protein Q4G43_16970, partial [Mobilicoccus sp.]|nr:hypothetical protein [Mobilicoccus sp.]
MSEHTVTATEEDVRRYVADVRDALADLAPEEVDELTGGMGADLTEMVTERGGTAEDRLGPPAAYARDLRQAAGLPAAEPRAHDPGLADQVREQIAAWRADLAALRERNPAVDAALNFVLSLRPAWWLVRGALIAVAVVFAYGLGVTAALPLALLLTLVSLWAGIRAAAPDPAPTAVGTTLTLTVLGAFAALITSLLLVSILT